MSNFTFTEQEYKTLLQRLDALNEKAGIKLSSKEIILGNKDVLRMLQVSPRTLMGWRTQGIIDFHQVGAKIYYTQENINDFLQRHSIKRFK